MPPVAVTIMNFAFSPASVTVPRGTTVIWTNRDSAPHSVVNDGSTVFGAGQVFSSPSFGQGQNYSFTFTNAGTYPYHCGIHLSMHGTIIVM
jgi:plastocyanin